MVEITRGFCTLKKFPLAEKKKLCLLPTRPQGAKNHRYFEGDEQSVGHGEIRN